MRTGLTFRRAEVTDFEAVLDLAGQLASQIEEEIPPLTLAQFEHIISTRTRRCAYCLRSTMKESLA